MILACSVPRNDVFCKSVTKERAQWASKTGHAELLSWSSSKDLLEVDTSEATGATRHQYCCHSHKLGSCRQGLLLRTDLHKSHSCHENEQGQPLVDAQSTAQHGH
ncbi:hypothetical protein INR49_002317 [Caranx melampygus]|nr:hypothetical protein INR49_002317 [Caranx melampygus]